MRRRKDRKCQEIYDSYPHRSRAGTECLGDYRGGRSDSYFYPILVYVFSIFHFFPHFPLLRECLLITAGSHRYRGETYPDGP